MRALSFISAAALLCAALVAPAAVHATQPAPSSVHTAPATQQGIGNKGTLESVIKLRSCSAAWVRFPTSYITDRALMLTNGHCMSGGMPGPGVVYVNRPMRMTGDILRKDGTSAMRVESDTVMYGTMTQTDMAILQLTVTHEEIVNKTGLQPLTIAPQAAGVGDAISVPSGYWKQVYTCSVDKRVFELLEGPYVWKDSLRYAKSPQCQTKGGTSGSPVVSLTTGEVVGVNNTGHDGGRDCQMNSPCERDTPGGATRGMVGRKYGQRVDWVLGCVTPQNKIDVTLPTCELPRPRQ